MLLDKLGRYEQHSVRRMTNDPRCAPDLDLQGMQSTLLEQHLVLKMMQEPRAQTRYATASGA